MRSNPKWTYPKFLFCSYRESNLNDACVFFIQICYMKEDNGTDWMLINLKFRGKCIGCGKEITSGRALWSRLTKSIKHVDCTLSSQTSSNNEETVSASQKQETHRRFKKTIVNRCFICGNGEPEEDEYDINEYSDLKESKSESYICQSCLQREDAFEAYRQIFLQKIKRFTKQVL